MRKAEELYPQITPITADDEAKRLLPPVFVKTTPRQAEHRKTRKTEARLKTIALQSFILQDQDATTIQADEKLFCKTYVVEVGLLAFVRGFRVFRGQYLFYVVDILLF